eukprot:3552110-Rhodomonas_salina.4
MTGTTGIRRASACGTTLNAPLSLYPSVSRPLESELSSPAHHHHHTRARTHVSGQQACGCRANRANRAICTALYHSPRAYNTRS